MHSNDVWLQDMLSQRENIHPKQRDAFDPVTRWLSYVLVTAALVGMGVFLIWNGIALVQSQYNDFTVGGIFWIVSGSSLLLLWPFCICSIRKPV